MAHGSAPSRNRSALARWWGGHGLAQGMLLATTLALAMFLLANIGRSMRHLGMEPNLAYLWRPAAFDIAESLIPYQAGDLYARAILVGLLNTAKLAFFGCLLATVLGVSLGVLRQAGNRLLARLIEAYVEIVRNTPLTLQLFFWIALTHALPPVRQALQPLPGVFLSIRGVFLPWPGIDAGGLALGWPTLHGFNITGGVSLTPEFAAMLAGLTVYYSASISESVRSGIESVHAGQWEAARALGLARRRIIRLIVLPQAMRVITPLMTSSYLDLTKDTTLGILIGFTEVTAVIKTSANNTGNAVETIIVLLAVFLSISLPVSGLINLYNRRLVRRGVVAR